jgi:hypothetical protein
MICAAVKPEQHQGIGRLFIWNPRALFAFMRAFASGSMRIMTRGRVHSIICLMVYGVAGMSVARAEPGNWRIAQAPGGTSTASLLSTNTLSTGNRSIEYHPRLTIACRTGQASGWSQSVRVRDGLSGRGAVPVSVRLDGGETSETWRLGGRNRSLTLDGKDGVTRLLRAKRLRLNWSNGFFSGTGEAVFNLAGIKDAVTRIATRCGVDLP